jgi:hypothetical protein
MEGLERSWSRFDGDFWWDGSDFLAVNEPDLALVPEQSDLWNDVNMNLDPSPTLYSSCQTENIFSHNPLQARNEDACKVPSNPSKPKHQQPLDG